MKVTFLGTGTSQGIPVIACDCEVCRSFDPRDNRLRSSVLVETNETTIVIDTGPDFRQQMLRANVQKLDAVFFTHEHKDHVAGLDDVRAFNFKFRKDMEVYATERVQTALKREFHYVFAEYTYPGVPKVNLNDLGSDPIQLGDMNVIPLDVMHYKLPVKAFRIGDFTYVTDANYIAPEEMEKIKGSKVLVLNALRKETHISHFTLEEAVDVAKQVGAEQTYFTHISHLLGRHEEVSKELPNNVFIAEDGLEIVI